MTPWALQYYNRRNDMIEDKKFDIDSSRCMIF